MYMIIFGWEGDFCNICSFLDLRSKITNKCLQLRESEHGRDEEWDKLRLGKMRAAELG